MEQAIFAALDCHNYYVADSCILLLNKEFPNSLRVQRYLECSREASEE